MKNISLNKENSSLEELERYVKLSKNVLEKNRFLAMRMLWLGEQVSTVCKYLMVSDVAVYNWLHRFNAKGVDGLLVRHRGGRPRLVQEADFNNLLNVFEEPQKVGQVHWTAKKFHEHLKESLCIECDYSTVLKYLKKANYVMKYGRSWPSPPEGNEDRRKEHIAIMSGLINDSSIKLWFMDEAGFDGDPRPRRGWAKKGERKKIYRTQKHLRMNVSGMCCPVTGEFFALEFPFTDRTTFQAFLNTANKEIQPSQLKEYIVLDNASWHKSASINWGRFQPIYLPPYSPDLNPIERIWAYLKEHFFNSFTAKNLDELIAQLDIALCSLFDDKNIVASIAALKPG